ncbi:hypothetical protein GCM10008107_08000 [Psychrosphaera saromensis]|uniref:DUF2971 domain-containing protein n=1 Tax=Psychrosphaera saromensis TaxID=716813 RepID=A0A2S7UVB5_9GAMM|nr:DUF2971 domain-containing protein [Psychrosphaera saromensis]PQJ53897.1 hypothetical protein BTO11_09625 [Psychrosphaera saromensis]GHB61538.1 hypothetical protein GCM10008107_08000 [Psychrosphaera saromensis]GLQ15303.1 hypothetical protein GCM10007917_27580 [Psychrosphaera saromensis]
MRVYHFLNEQYALDALVNKTLKVSRLKSLNDPFEYYHIDTDNCGTRSVIKGRLNRANRELGIICFSQNYINPVQWAHYGDSHRGICLGFDIPDELLFEIDYVKKRTAGSEFKNSLALQGRDYIQYMLSKKHEHWRYEEEVRTIIPFSEKVMDDRLIFTSFSDELSVREVILGVRCKSSMKDIKRYIRKLNCDISVVRLEMSQTEYAMRLAE